MSPAEPSRTRSTTGSAARGTGPRSNIDGCRLNPARAVAADRERVVGGGEHRPQAAGAVGERGVEQRPAHAAALQPGPHGVRREQPGQVAPHADRRAEQAVPVLGHPAAARVGAAAGARRGPATRPPSPPTGASARASRAAGPHVQVEERRVGEPLDGGHVVGGHRPHQVVGGHRRSSHHGPDGREVFGCRHARADRPRQVRRHAERRRGRRGDRRGLAPPRARRRARPGADGRRRARLRRRAARRRWAASCSR